MKKIRKCCVIVLLVVLFPANIFAQERRDKEQTYVLENPYEVNKITPLQGKKIKNVV
jgi:alkaline phosphatase